MKNTPVAYQIYSARKDAEQDLLSVLRQLKALGYDGVEFAGFYGYSAQDVKAMLDECGLKAVSSHVSLSLIREDMQAVIDYHKAIGCPYIAVPHLAVEERAGQPAFADVLRLIYQFACLCHQNGIQLLYHNHAFEFDTFSGMYALDFLYAAMPEELLKTEIDVCWVKYAGEDPVAYLQKYAGRAPIVHLKDYVGRRESDAAPYGPRAAQELAEAADTPFEFRPVGHGCQDLVAVVEAAQQAGAQYFVVEQDSSVGRTPLEAAAMSIESLRKIGLKG